MRLAYILSLIVISHGQHETVPEQLPILFGRRIPVAGAVLDGP